MRALQYLVVLSIGFAGGYYLPQFTMPAQTQELIIPAPAGKKAALITWEGEGVEGATPALAVNGTFRAIVPKGLRYRVTPL